MTILLKKINKNKEKILYIISIIIILFLNIFNIKYKTINMKIIVLYIFISAIIFLAFLMFYKNQKNINVNNLPRTFLFFSLIIGSIYLLVSPLFSGSDEHNHYYRIYEITEGVWITPTNQKVGSKLPKSLEEVFIISGGHNTKIKYKNSFSTIKVPLNKNELEQYGKVWTKDYSNTALYSPIQYLPQIIGFSFGKLFGFGPYLLGILGRVFNLIFFSILGYFCLKIIPKYSFYIFLILISPNIMSLATTLSADAFTIVLSLLFISIIYKKVQIDSVVNLKTKLSLMLLAIIISLCKVVYFPITFLIFLIPKEKFLKKEKIVFACLLIGISLFTAFFWIKMTEGVFLLSYDKSFLQRIFIIKNPFEYLFIFIRTYSINFVTYIEEIFVGSRMYHSQLKIPPILSYIYLFIVFCGLSLEEKYIFSIKTKLLVFIKMIIIIVLLSTAIYIQNTAQYFSVANQIITGIQGRYFIPLLFLIPIFMNKKYVLKYIDKIYLYKLVLCINLMVLMYAVANFII